MKRLVAVGCVVCAGIVLAMPTRKDLAKAQEMVNDVTASDVKALKAGTKKPAEVAATHMDLAAKADSEAEKYLLLQGAFNLSAKAGDFDAAADALEAMVKEIPDMRPDVIVEIYNKAIFRSMKDKAPRLYAIKEAARKAAANRKRLPELEKAARVKPQDAKAQKALGECHAELGNWDKALAAFAKTDGDLAKTAKAELDGTLKPQELADFWWDYNEGSNAYRLHAVTFYRDALADDGFQGLARERAERRIKEMEADNTVVIAKRQDDEPMTKLVVPSVSYKGGETIKVLVNSKKKTEIEFAAIPAGEFTMGPRVPAEWRARDQKWNVFTTWDKPHKVSLTYPFLMMKGPLSYAEADAIDLQTALKGHAKFTPGTESIIADSPVMELSWNDIQCLIRKLNESVRLPVSLRRFQGYEFRLPTEAEWRYAMRGGSDAKDWGAFTSWPKEWGGYWWGKLPNGVSGQKGSPSRGT